MTPAREAGRHPAQSHGEFCFLSPVSLGSAVSLGMQGSVQEPSAGSLGRGWQGQAFLAVQMVSALTGFEPAPAAGFQAWGLAHWAWEARVLRS